jgi:hypothetical protein
MSELLLKIGGVPIYVVDDRRSCGALEGGLPEPAGQAGGYRDH